MNEQLKKRLVGASVLAALAVIFVPMLIDEESRVRAPADLPLAPKLADPSTRPFQSQVIAAPETPEPVTEPAGSRPSEAESTAESSGAPAKTVKSTNNTSPEPTSSTAAASQATPRVGLVAWAIQVGSFREQTRADALVKKLRKAGIDTLAPERVQIKGVTWHRVRVGPEIERARAEALLPKVNKISGLQGRVIRYP